MNKSHYVGARERADGHREHPAAAPPQISYDDGAEMTGGIEPSDGEEEVFVTRKRVFVTTDEWLVGDYTKQYVCP
jgi:hypothetical protein